MKGGKSSPGEGVSGRIKVKFDCSFKIYGRILLIQPELKQMKGQAAEQLHHGKSLAGNDKMIDPLFKRLPEAAPETNRSGI